MKNYWRRVFKKILFEIVRRETILSKSGKRENLVKQGKISSMRGSGKIVEGMKTGS